MHPPTHGHPWHPDSGRTGEGAWGLHRADLQKVSSLPVLPYGCIPSGWALHAAAPDVDLICMTVFLRAAPTRSDAKHADKGKGSDLEMTK